MNLDKDNVKKIMQLITFTILLLVAVMNYQLVFKGIMYLLDLVSPFILGAAMAFVLNVPMRAIEKSLFMGRRTINSRFAQKIKRPCSIVLTLIGVAGVIAIVAYIVIPSLEPAITKIISESPTVITETINYLESKYKQYPKIVELIGDFEVSWAKISESIVSYIQVELPNAFNSTVTIIGNVVSSIMNFVIAFFFSIYILMQKEKLGRQMGMITKALFKEKTSEKMSKIADLTFSTFANFLSGQCLDAMIVGVMFVIALSLFGFPYAMLIGVLIAFTALIPVFGAFVGCGVGCFLILLDSPIKAIWFIVLFLVIQAIDENFFYPNVVGNAVGLPAMWVLMAVTVGGATFGVLGMLVFIPLASVLYALFREFILDKLERKRILAMAAASEDVENKEGVTVSSNSENWDDDGALDENGHPVSNGKKLFMEIKKAATKMSKKNKRNKL